MAKRESYKSANAANKKAREERRAKLREPNTATKLRESGLAKLQREMQALVDSGAGRPMVSPIHPGLVALKRALKECRDDEQGGYPSYCGDGKWSFAATSVGHFEPEEVNALFDLVGIVPDVVPVKGYCEDCKFAKPYEKGSFVVFIGGGYTPKECCSCKGASMSNFKPRKTFPKNRGWWCYYCGKAFAKVEDRDTHSRIREVMPGKACA
jgi:hypothetical protein